MAAYTFRSEALYDPLSDVVVENGSGGKLVAVLDGPALPIYDLNDNPISEITSGPSGQTLQFKADVYRGLIQFGSVAVYVTAEEVADMAIAAQGAIDTANAALAQAEATAAALQALVDAGSSTSLPPGITLDDIPNSATRVAMTVPERTKLATVEAGATALKLGNTSTTAMPGNTQFSPTVIGAVATVGGAFREWKPRPASQGYPTIAQGAQEGDIASLYDDSAA